MSVREPEDVEDTKLEGYWLGLARALEIVSDNKKIDQVVKVLISEIKKVTRVLSDSKNGIIKGFIEQTLHLRYTEEGIKEIQS